MKSSLKIALIYILLGGTWVAMSSLYLDAVQEKLGLKNIVGIEVIKALAFVIASGVLIYFLVDRSFKLDKQVWGNYVVVFDNIPICMWLVDKKSSKIVSSNRIAQVYFQDELGRSEGLYFEEFLAGANSKIPGILCGKKQVFREQLLIDKNGSERVMDIYSVPFIRNGKEKVMVAAVDNTVLHDSLLEKVALNKSLQEQNDRLKKFSFMNSHNIRRPLSNILGIADLFREGKVNKEVIDMLIKSSEDLDDEVKKMNELLAEEMQHNEFSVPELGHHSKSIMIVDDDKVQHLINKRLLLRNDPNLTLHFFSNPIEALGWLEDHQVDLLLLDINMPEMKGWDFLDKLIEKKIKVEVKMLSSSIDPRDEEKSKQYDMVSGFLVKPLKKEALADIL